MKNIKQRLTNLPIMAAAIIMVVTISLNTILYLCGCGKDWLLVVKAAGRAVLVIGILYVALFAIVAILHWGYKNERDDF